MSVERGCSHLEGSSCITCIHILVGMLYCVLKLFLNNKVNLEATARL